MRRNNGFTLIELLTVIAIISILASMLFPVFSKARDKARGISCISNLKQICNALMMYRQDYDERSPKSTNCDSVNFPGLEWQQPQFVLNTYVKNFQVFKCPNDLRVLAQVIGGTSFGGSPGVDPRNPTFPDPCIFRWYSYGFNGVVPINGGGRDFGDGLADAAVVQPSRVVYMMDHHEADGKFEGNGDLPIKHDTIATQCAAFPCRCNTDVNGSNTVSCNNFIRHNNGFNALHYDGHAKWYYIWGMPDVAWEWNAN